jgi:hypothetical protein
MPRPNARPPHTLQSYLETHDALCDWCGYNLRGVKIKRCPECGGPLDLDFVMNPPSLAQGGGRWTKRKAAFFLTSGVVVIGGIIFCFIRDGF